MDLELLLSFLDKLEKLKNITRHSWTSEGRPESVAEHSWRLAAMVCLLRSELKGYDVDKMIIMALFHDLSEVKFGDVPAFDKTDTDITNEKVALEEIAAEYEKLKIDQIIEMVREFDDKISKESKAVNAIDKLEAVIQHNEANIKTWIDREYDLNCSYGVEECKIEKILENLREIVKGKSLEKIRTEKSILY